ncbi:peptide chain release factor N(5)-glutamine methyltransferase [Candidatus Saccharibacteria bacterium]|nr:peptide chain release factor N(5)-glutamine methyltransferase [Candidatus Saccharibacteria bacterium]
MNANSRPAAPVTLKTWLRQAAAQLQAAGIRSARLDSELLLTYVLQVDRPYLISHDDEPLSQPVLVQLQALLERRLERVPLAYLTGYKEFYGHRFAVSPATLVPRPETEVLVAMAVDAMTPGAAMLDIGTGSGCVAISVGLAMKGLIPAPIIRAIDVSEAALAMARDNARALGADVDFYLEDFRQHQGMQHDVVAANLPYVNPAWQNSPELAHEPPEALYADDDGLALINELLAMTPALLRPGGQLLLEADPRQLDRITEKALESGLVLRQRQGCVVHLARP